MAACAGTDVFPVLKGHGELSTLVALRPALLTQIRRHRDRSALRARLWRESAAARQAAAALQAVAARPDAAADTQAEDTPGAQAEGAARFVLPPLPIAFVPVVGFPVSAAREAAIAVSSVRGAFAAPVPGARAGAAAAAETADAREPMPEFAHAPPLDDTHEATPEDAPAVQLEEALALTLEDTRAPTFEDTRAAPLEDVPARTLDDTPAPTLVGAPASPLEDASAPPLGDEPAPPTTPRRGQRRGQRRRVRPAAAEAAGEKPCLGRSDVAAMIQDTFAEIDVEVGVPVTLHGLQNQTELNGQAGVVVPGPRDGVRVPVRLPGRSRPARVAVRCLFVSGHVERCAPVFNYTPVEFLGFLAAHRDSLERQFAKPA